jgi:predicted nuclease of predicted toxin-antitoxin system
MTGFLFDENLPAVSGLSPNLPIVHAASLGKRMSDSALWEHAKLNDLVIVTKLVNVFLTRIQSVR